MEVLVANDGLLTNYEVMQLLEQNREDRKKSKQSNFRDQSTVTLEKQVLQYLKNTNDRTSKIKSNQMKEYLRNLKSICHVDEENCLTEAELIQLSNHMPIQPVEVHLVSYFIKMFVLYPYIL